MTGHGAVIGVQVYDVSQEQALMVSQIAANQAIVVISVAVVLLVLLKFWQEFTRKK